MRYILIITIMLGDAVPAAAQQIYFEAGKTISSFDYRNSAGKYLENLQSTDHLFLNIGIRKNIWTKNLLLDVNGSYNGYGAIGSDEALDNYFKWDLSYLGLNAGLDYRVYHPGNFEVYLKASVGSAVLMRGTQTLNNQVYNLKDEEDFNSAIYTLRAGLGMQYKLSGRLSAFTDYTYGSSAYFKEVQGTLKIKAHNIGIGIVVSLAKPTVSNVTTATTTDNLKITQLRIALDQNTQKIKALEKTAQQMQEQKSDMLHRKEVEMISIKESISNALVPHRGNALSIDEQNGKVKIILDNDLLFSSGSWKITPEGLKAVNALGEVLEKNPGMSIIVEGHTDDRPFSGSGDITSNWDLSLKRATAIVELLIKNKNIDPKKLTAAGKGEFAPIASNNTEEGRAKNRRIEVIMEPDLGKLSSLIND